MRFPQGFLLWILVTCIARSGMIKGLGVFLPEGTLEPTALTPIHFTPVPVRVVTADIDVIDPANDLCANIVDDFAALLVG